MSKYEVNKFYINDCIYFSCIKYACIELNNDACRYVACYSPNLESDGNGIYFTSWAQGHYFENYKDMKIYITTKLSDYLNDLSLEIADITNAITDFDKRKGWV